jgi:hypothetical protein
MNPYKSALGWMAVIGLILGPLSLAAGLAAALSDSALNVGPLFLLVPLGYVLCGLGVTSLFAWLIVGAIRYAAPSRTTAHTGQLQRIS